MLLQFVAIDQGFTDRLRDQGFTSGDSESEPFIAAHNMILSHATAVDVYGTIYQERLDYLLGYQNLQRLLTETLDITLTSSGSIDIGQSFSNSVECIEVVDIEERQKVRNIARDEYIGCSVGRLGYERPVGGIVIREVAEQGHRPLNSDISSHTSLGVDKGKQKVDADSEIHSGSSSGSATRTVPLFVPCQDPFQCTLNGPSIQIPTIDRYYSTFTSSLDGSECQDYAATAVDPHVAVSQVCTYYVGPTTVPVVNEITFGCTSASRDVDFVGDVVTDIVTESCRQPHQHVEQPVTLNNDDRHMSAPTSSASFNSVFRLCVLISSRKGSVHAKH